MKDEVAVNTQVLTQCHYHSALQAHPSRHTRGLSRTSLNLTVPLRPLQHIH